MSSARENISHKAEADTTRLFAQGHFKLAYSGNYTEGKRKDQACVVKVFKKGSAFQASFFGTELQVSAKALEIVTQFNRDKIIDKRLRLNLPTVWEFVETREKCLVEPRIQNFENFNSNSGWTPRVSSLWTDAMQALSHYSYHISKQTLLLCDLQGGSYRDGFVLTDPVIMSNDDASKQQYGPTDLGPRGISTFFAYHQCNRYCRPEWRFPEDRRVYYPKRKGSTMELKHLPTRWSRESMTVATTTIAEEDSETD